MATKQQTIPINLIDKGGGSPISLSMCFEQPFTPTHITANVARSGAVAVNARSGKMRRSSKVRSPATC